MVQDDSFDLLVIGGGINGTGIAMDAAHRGLRVLLCEQQDLAEGTSSRSSKLIHGGLRYLEHGEFRLVREALSEREVLMAMAPHIIWPLRFRLPLQPQQRPAWLIRAGLFLYDHLGRRNHLPASTARRFDDGELQPQFKKGFEYSDAWVDDARLVVLCARQAARDGAEVLTRWRCTAAQRSGDGWLATLVHVGQGTVRQVQARALVNAAGPWVNRLLEPLLGCPGGEAIQLVKGSHIVVPRLTTGDHAYLLQHDDGRIIFVLPYEDQFSLVGTTEELYQGDPNGATVSAAEEQYLLTAINRCFAQQRDASMIRYRFAGVRPLLNGGGQQGLHAITREYRLQVDHREGRAPLLSVFGGKLTSFRQLAAKAVNQLAPFFPGLSPSRTESLVLPGGAFASREQLAADIKQRYPWLPAAMAERWLRSYGTLIDELIDGAGSLADLGEQFGATLTAREVDYLCQREWALSAEDILWRRSKQGLFLDNEQQARLALYLSER